MDQITLLRVDSIPVLNHSSATFLHTFCMLLWKALTGSGGPEEPPFSPPSLSLQVGSLWPLECVLNVSCESGDSSPAISWVIRVLPVAGTVGVIIDD